MGRVTVEFLVDQLANYLVAELPQKIGEFNIQAGDSEHDYDRFMHRWLSEILCGLGEKCHDIGFYGNGRWIQASERKPTAADGDYYGDVIVRWDDDGKWIAMSLPFNEVSDYQEWLDGAFVDKADGWNPDTE